MHRRKTWMFVFFVVVAALVTATGCKNNNLFKSFLGEPSTADALLSDAQVALSNGDYSKALGLYERVLAQDPNNSDALYGAAIAAVGSSGLNFGQLLANIIDNNGTSAPSIHGLGDFVAAGHVGSAAVSACGGGTGSILNGVDCSLLNAVIDLSICRLQQITGGLAHGTIERTSVNVYMNLAILYILRAVLRPLQQGFFDVNRTGNDFTVTRSVSLDNTACSNNTVLIQQTGKDVAATYALFNRAVDQLGLSNSAIITKVRDDVAHIAGLLLDPANTSTVLPSNCLTALSSVGIDKDTVTHDLNVFIPSTGC